MDARGSCRLIRALLSRINAHVRTLSVAPGEGPLAESEGRWRPFLGKAVGSCFEHLKRHWYPCYPSEKFESARNLGIIFGPGPQAKDMRASSCTTGGIPVFHIEEILDILKSPQDVLDFVWGFLSRRPGPAAIVMADFAGKELEARQLGREKKANLLECLVALSTDFGTIDEGMKVKEVKGDELWDFWEF